MESKLTYCLAYMILRKEFLFNPRLAVAEIKRFTESDYMEGGGGGGGLVIQLLGFT